MHFSKPSKIQAETLPMIMGRPPQHLIAQAHNGSGKTTCFVLGMLSRVDPALHKPQALCMCPTRELVVQNVEVLRKMATFTGITCQHSAAADAKAQAALSRMPPISDHVVIATPGTLNTWLQRKQLPMKCVWPHPSLAFRSVRRRALRSRVMYTTTQQVLTTMMNEFVQNTIFRLTAPQPRARAERDS